MTLEEIFASEKRSDIAKHFSGAINSDLRQLFGNGKEGAQRALEHVKSMDSSILKIVDLATAIRYHEIARRQIQRGIGAETQGLRMLVMEHIIRNHLVN